MAGFVRRLVAAIVVGCGVLGATAGVGWADDRSPDAEVAASDRAALDGFRLGHLPAGLGELVSDFAYEWGGVSFASRVWERGPDSDGAYSVDLMVSVLRGARLDDGPGLRRFMKHYLEEDAPDWAWISVRGQPGWIGEGRIFFLVKPGVAVSILLDTDRFSWLELLRIAYGISPADRS